MATVFAPPTDITVPALRFEALTDGSHDEPCTYDRESVTFIEQIAERAKQNGTSDLLGEVIRFQIADGYAQYVVWNTKPLQLIHLPLGDAYQAHAATVRGLRIADVREQVGRNQRLAAFLAERADATA